MAYAGRRNFKMAGFFESRKREILKGGPEKTGFFRFWEIFFIRFGKLFLLNVVYFICIMPVLSYFLQLLNGQFNILKIPFESQPLVYGPLGVALSFLFTLPAPVYFALLGLSAIFFGPLTAGFTYVTRNFVRREHADISDMFVRAGKNFFQGLLLGIWDLLVIAGLIMLISRGGMFFVIFGIAAIYVVVRNYVYTIIVTFKLNIISAMVNAFIFIIMGFWRNLLIILYTAAISIIIPIFPLVDMFLVILIYFSLVGMINQFLGYPVINKYMIEKAHLKTPPEETVEAEAVEQIEAPGEDVE